MTAAISVGTGLAIAAAGTAVGAGAAIYSANTAAGAQKSAAQTASNTQMSMFNQIQGNEAPWVGQGQQANTALSQFYGLPGQSGSASTPNYNQILSNLPGYQFQLQQGQQATERNLAANGLLNSGAAQKSLTQFGQGLASSYAGQYAQGLQNISQMGEAGAAGVASAGMNAANQIGANDIYAGNASAAGAANTSNAINSGLGSLTGLASYYSNPYASSIAPPSSGYGLSYYGAGGLGSTDLGSSSSTIGGSYTPAFNTGYSQTGYGIGGLN